MIQKSRKTAHQKETVYSKIAPVRQEEVGPHELQQVFAADATTSKTPIQTVQLKRNQNGNEFL